MDFHVYLHLDSFITIERKLDALTTQLTRLETRMTNELEVAITRMEAQITPLTSVVDGSVTLLAELAQLLRDAVAAGGNAAALAARISAVADVVDANKERLANANVTNTPAG